jgi:hypothetical protein
MTFKVFRKGQMRMVKTPQMEHILNEFETDLDTKVMHMHMNHILLVSDTKSTWI